MIKNFESYKMAQNMARTAMARAAEIIRPGMTEKEIRKEVEITLIREGSDMFWYHGIGALVHVGERTLVSQGGREYRSTDTVVGENDVVTLDIAPSVGLCWGDYARTIFVENGVAILDPAKVEQEDHKAAITCELQLHKFLMETARPDMTFEEMWALACEELERLGCKNLDYSSNFGHSVEEHERDRVYLEKGTKTLLGDVHSFTFEPHIQMGDMPFGVKRENIYYFEDGKLCCM